MAARQKNAKMWSWCGSSQVGRQWGHFLAKWGHFLACSAAISEKVATSCGYAC